MTGLNGFGGYCEKTGGSGLARCEHTPPLVEFMPTITSMSNPKAELREKDAMICRSCGNEERASEGYPCASCGTFVCVMCSIRGVLRCRNCAEGDQAEPMPAPPRRQIPLMDWPEH